MTVPPHDAESRPPAERRSTERLEILGDLRGEVMVYQPMAVREISHGGALIETSFPLQLDSLHDLRLELGDASVVVKGRVVHCSISDMDREFVTYRAGLEFIQPGGGVRDVIASFIGALKSSRRLT
ncbi:MAG: PilZ domain-containing protein [Vicinamibacterales bacterium]